MFILHLNNKALNKENLLGALPFYEDIEEKAVIKFCHDWFSNQPTFIVPTSGSTGTPKTIKITRNQIIESVRATQQAFGLMKGDTCLLNLSAKHIAGKMMLARAMEIGMEITFTQPSAHPLDEIKTHAAFYAFVPLQLQNILNTSPKQVDLLNQAKAIIIGGAKVSLELKHQTETIKAPVYATYGMTETVSHIAIQRLNGENKDTYFQALPDVHLELDERGCLKIKAPVTNNKWLQTNDLALIHDNGFELLGRLDNIINTGGLKVQAEKVEAKVEAFFLTQAIHQRFFVAALPHPYFGEQVTLFVEGHFELKDRLLDYLSKQLKKHEVPKEVICVDLFSETTSGKLDKQTTLTTLL